MDLPLSGRAGFCETSLKAAEARCEFDMGRTRRCGWVHLVLL